jgi:hypothetical protein
MKYAYLTAEQQAKMLEERLATIEAEHYQHEINRLVGVGLAKTATDSNLAEAEQIVAQEEAAQKLLESAYRATVQALDELRSQDGSRPEATGGG